MIYQEIWQKISEHQIITIFRHVNPDGDALGSQFGLKELIKRNFPNKIVYCLGTNINKKNDLIFPPCEEVDSKIIESSLAIVLDTANINRVDDTRFIKAKSIIKIDHHVFVEKFGGIDLVDIYASACAEMIGNLMIQNKLQNSEQGASYLFTGIMTDTGRLLYPSVTPNTYEVVKELSKYQFSREAIFTALYTQSIQDVRLKGYISNNFKVTKNGVGYLELNQKILTKLGSDENAAAFVNTLSSIEGVEIWVLFGQSKEEWYRTEIRSKNISIVDIAKKYGGGGHRLASGAKIYQDQIQNMVNDLDYLIFESKMPQTLKVALNAAKVASEVVMKVYRGDKTEIEIKEDNSPVTNADIAADKAIKLVIEQEFINHKILSEETFNNENRSKFNHVWIIDPIDGTKEFINRTGEFAINIAYVEHQKLVLGVVAVPDKEEIYFAYQGLGAYRIKNEICTKLETSKRLPGELVMARSRNHYKKEEEDFYLQNKDFIPEFLEIGSSYKLCLVASGEVDIVYKVGEGTKEWDIAAPDIIIKESGGVFLDGQQKAFKYNKKDVYNHHGYIAINTRKNLRLFSK